MPHTLLCTAHVSIAFSQFGIHIVAAVHSDNKHTHTHVRARRSHKVNTAIATRAILKILYFN